MTTTDKAREAWNDLLKEMYAETGQHVDPNMAGVRGMHRLADRDDTIERQDAIIERQASKIAELEHICKAVGAL